MSLSKDVRPIVIIGAGRSGTNMLRDALSKFSTYGTWPCDEINYIWRHGNINWPNDEFPRDLAKPEVKRFIRHEFEKIAQRLNISNVIEKTCANSLRVGFIDEILPEALFIHIVRDGRDVIASAQKRWTAELDIPYILKKVRYVPLPDLPYYALRYFGNRVYKILSGESRLAFWGPRFAEMDEVIRTHSLEEVCAMQWRRCIERAEEDFSRLAPSRVLNIRYEDITLNSEAALQQLANFLGVEFSEKEARLISSKISPKNIGKWNSDLSQEVLDRINPIVLPVLKRHNYSQA